MKKYAIINGLELLVISSSSLDAAVTKAQNICDCSKEIIVREVKTITDNTK